MARWGLAFTPKVDKCSGNSQARRKSCSGGASPRNDVSKNAVPGSPRFGSRSEIASSSPRSSVASTRERSQQHNAIVNERRSSNLETTQTEGRRTSESHVVKEPTPEVAKHTECEVEKEAEIEPEAEWTRKQSSQYVSRGGDSCASSCWNPQVMPRFGMENAADDNVVNTPSTLNETASSAGLDVDATNPEPSPEPSDQGDADTTKQSGLGRTCIKDDSIFSWTTALGGKLDDLCERTLALEKELREHCSDVPTEAEPHYMNEESFPGSPSALDFMPEPCKDGALIPGTADEAVERELNSLRTCVSGMQANFGELRAMVQQLGGELRNLHQSRRRESASQSAIVLVFPNSTPSLKQVARVVEPPSLPVQAKHPMQPCMSPGRTMGTQASVTASPSVQHPLLPPGALCPPQQAVGATNLNSSLRRLSGTPASPRQLQVPALSPVQRFSSMPAAYCRPSDTSMPNIVTTQQPPFWNRTPDIRNIQQRNPLKVS